MRFVGFVVRFIVVWMSYRGRIAPSPTGLLHLGHARTFLTAAERARGGALVLRNDDLDTERSRPDFVAAMVEDLAWLGISWQEGLHANGSETGPYRPYAQSLRGTRYGAAFERLRSAGAIYPCTCSRRDLHAAAHAPHAEDEDEPVYPGTCRGRVEADGEVCAWRFHVPEGERIAFDDALQGPQSFVAGLDFGDFVVQRRDSLPSYQLATVVDDAAMAITEVVRGHDLLRSTARQMLLIRALGLSQPAYAHCSLVLNEHGDRLAKRDAARSLRHLREAGYSAEAVRRMAMSE